MASLESLRSVVGITKGPGAAEEDEEDTGTTACEDDIGTTGTEEDEEEEDDIGTTEGCTGAASTGSMLRTSMYWSCCWSVAMLVVCLLFACCWLLGNVVRRCVRRRGGY